MPGARLAERQDGGGRDFGVSWLASACSQLATYLPSVAEITSVDASTQTAAPNNEPSNPPFIRSGHLAAPGFSEHRIYWEEYGSPAGEPVIVMHGGPGCRQPQLVRPVFQSAAIPRRAFRPARLRQEHTQ